MGFGCSLGLFWLGGFVLAALGFCLLLLGSRASKLDAYMYRVGLWFCVGFAGGWVLLWGLGYSPGRRGACPRVFLM
ncbi:hypothetical protein XM47_12905 [Catenovulum maritimum]|uniref:Uncharacterized protein n=1 Tax=Catenovulum maritimum TaxID=1513271 RepID=A0A0J8GVQ4_9ALTE|nr:hypothetical protein XM47_12905 [Catenovulum maritimum]